MTQKTFALNNQFLDRLSYKAAYLLLYKGVNDGYHKADALA